MTCSVKCVVSRSGRRPSPITTRLTWEGGVVARCRTAGGSGEENDTRHARVPGRRPGAWKGLGRSMSTDTEVGAELTEPDASGHLVAHGEIRQTEVRQTPRVVIRFAGDSGDGMQLTGDRFPSEAASFGNDLATLPNFPAEIRAPAGTLPGVSSFQLHFADYDILT